MRLERFSLNGRFDGQKVETAVFNCMLYRLLTLLSLLLFACGGSQPQATPAPVGTVWINGFEKCPSHAEYGDQVVNAVNLWRDTQLTTPALASIPHGTEVDLIATQGSFLQVRYRGQEGYIQALLTSNYDPADGVRPDEDSCL